VVRGVVAAAGTGATSSPVRVFVVVSGQGLGAADRASAVVTLAVIAAMAPILAAVSIASAIAAPLR
jgi:hypothetical protein